MFKKEKLKKDSIAKNYQNGLKGITFSQHFLIEKLDHHFFLETILQKVTLKFFLNLS